MKLARLGALALGMVIAATAHSPARGEDGVDVPLSDCPEAVRKTIREESRGGRVESVSKETEDGKATYWADAVIGGKAYGIGVTEDGTLTEFSLRVDDHEIGLGDCPPAVQTTMRAEAGAAKIRDVRRELNLGVTVYATEYAVGGWKYRVMVAEDGTLTEKVLVIDEDPVALAECPAPVQKTLTGESKGGTLKDVTRSSGIGRRVYLAAYEAGGAGYSLIVAEDGTLISKTRDDPQ